MTIGRPVSSRASARISRPFAPRPWNAYGDERGLNAPPRSTVAPAAATARAVSSVCSRVSTVHGPATSPKKPSPIRLPAHLDDRRVGRQPARDERIGEELGRSGESPRDASLGGRDARTAGPGTIPRCGSSPASGASGDKTLGNYSGGYPPVRRDPGAGRGRLLHRRPALDHDRVRARRPARGDARRRGDALRDRYRPRALDRLLPEPRAGARRGGVAARLRDELRRAPPHDAVQGQVRADQEFVSAGALHATRC